MEVDTVMIHQRILDELSPDVPRSWEELLERDPYLDLVADMTSEVLDALVRIGRVTKVPGPQGVGDRYMLNIHFKQNGGGCANGQCALPDKP